MPLLAGTLLLALLLGAAAHAEEAPVATIRLSSATSGSSLSGHLVEGVMSFRGHDYLLTLRGVTESTSAVGSVRGMVRPRDVEGVYKPEGDALRNGSGVTIAFQPALKLEAGRLEIEVLSRMQPKVSGGHRESGVE